MAGWYRGHAVEELARSLDALPLAPGATEAFALLRRSGVATAIVSVTWLFAVERFAGRLGADYTYGTGLTEHGIDHVWPEDKGLRLAELGHSLGLEREAIAAVGDSDGDRELLESAELRFFVGKDPPEIPNLRHLPDANLLTIAKQIVGNQ
jgi:phosphoserine phosphatase